jgi:hypothetical protein
MSTDSTTSVTTTTSVPYKKRGSNHQPPRQTYHASGKNGARLIKKAIEQFKTLTGRSKLTPEERSTLAFFTFPMMSNREN